MRRAIAEILSVLWALIATAFMAGILGGFVGVIFVPVFLIGGFIFYTFVRTWMRDVLEVGNRTKRRINS